MPADNGLRLDKDQRLLPSRPKPTYHHPEQFVGSGKPGLRMPYFQDSKLLPEGQIFQKQIAAGTKKTSSQNR
jgi:hypothetical protein